MARRHGGHPARGHALAGEHVAAGVHVVTGEHVASGAHAANGEHVATGEHAASGAHVARALTAVLLALLALLPGAPGAAGESDEPLRSELYPVDWQPATPDAEGRFLHDFSYAGYRYGQPVPTEVPGPVLDVTEPPYRADPNGERDATGAIQAAIDDAGAAGGGTVHLPAGTYRVAPPDDSRAVLHIAHNGVLLRGEGPDRTRLLNASAQDMRNRAVVLVGPDRSDWTSWHDEPDAGAVRLTAAVLEPTRTLRVADATAFSVGDWVVLRSDTTRQWLADHPVAEEQRWETDTLEALVYHRRVTAVDAEAGTVDIDIPTRYRMQLRDDLRLHRVPAPVVGSGVADLAIGMRQSDLREEDEEDHERSGTRGWQAHQAAALAFNDTVHGWVDAVHTFRPDENDQDVHVLSTGIYVRDARNITIQHTDLRHPQYRGAGGNGYLYHLMGSDTLVRDARAQGGRHNYLVQSVQATGNVVLDSRAVDGERATELHRQLSVANLFDNLHVQGDTLEMAYRPYSNHAHTTTESVMWNVSGEHCTRGRLVLSQQLGWGYLIGTSGTGDCATVETPGGEGTEPLDWLEHHGAGERLEPRSLYLDQLERRLAAETAEPTPGPTVDDTAPTAKPGTAEPGPDPAPGMTATAWLALGVGLVVLVAAVTVAVLAASRRRR